VSVDITVNGERAQSAQNVAALLERMGIGAQARGVAVAVDGLVVPKSQWGDTHLPEGCAVEVVSATQGG
jgi:sulfur carrier protein